MTTRPTSPTTQDVIRAWLDYERENSHHALVAKVQSYDAAKQTADLVPVVRHAVAQPDGSAAYEDLPVLPAVPVLFPRAGAWFISLPLAAGDFVLVILTDAASEHWRAGDGSPQCPGDLRRNHLANAVCFPANFYPAGMALAHASATDLVLGKDDGARITLRADGSGDVTLPAGRDWTFNGGSTPVAKEGSATVGHTHVFALAAPSGGGAVTGTISTATDAIASGQGTPNVKVP